LQAVATPKCAARTTKLPPKAPKLTQQPPHQLAVRRTAQDVEARNLQEHRREYRLLPADSQSRHPRHPFQDAVGRLQATPLPILLLGFFGRCHPIFKCSQLASSEGATQFLTGHNRNRRGRCSASRWRGLGRIGMAGSKKPGVCLPLAPCQAGADELVLLAIDRWMSPGAGDATTTPRPGGRLRRSGPTAMRRQRADRLCDDYAATKNARAVFWPRCQPRP